MSGYLSEGEPGRLIGACDRLLTRERVRNYSLIFLCLGAVLLLAASISRFADPSARGAILPDFLAHWTGGRMVIEGIASDLYDPSVQAAIQAREAGDPTGVSWFVAPPFVALGYVPFATLPYALSALAWCLASGGALVCIGGKLRYMGPGILAGNSRVVLLATVSSYPAFETMASGQDSVLLLLVWLLGMRLVLRDGELAGGAVLALGLVKPQMVALVPLVLVAQRRWAALTVFLSAAAGFVTVSSLVLGWGRWGDWLSAVTGPFYAEEVQHGQAWKMAGLPALAAAMIGGGSAATIVSVGLAGVLGLAFTIWLFRVRADRDPMRVWVAAMAATVAISPHLVLYDAILMAPVCVYLLDRVRLPSVNVLVALTYILMWIAPSMAALSRTTPILSPLGMPWVALATAGIAYIVARLEPKPCRAVPAP